jgi:hypothetical protein
MSNQIEYRMAFLAGFGRVRVPAHLTDEEVIAQIHGADEEATPKKKTRKKP